MEKIPLKIHLIWFGDKNDLSFNFENLKKYAPNYEIKIWTKKDFDWDELKKISFVRKAYDEQEWAFLSDYLRAKILYEEGGVYLDADMKIVKNIEEIFVDKEAVYTFENTRATSMGICGSIKGNELFKTFMNIYEVYDEEKYIVGNVIWDFYIKKLGVKINGKTQSFGNSIIYDYRMFSLLEENSTFEQYAIHDHLLSWLPEKSRNNIKKIIGITQRYTFINIFYGLFFLLPKKRMKKIIKKIDYVNSNK